MEVIIAFTGHTNIEKCCGLPIPENGNVYDKRAYDRVIMIFLCLWKSCLNLKISH